MVMPQFFERVRSDPQWQTSGHISFAEGFLLSALVYTSRPKSLLETGTNHGVSAIFLVASADDGAVLHTFDPVNRGAEAFWERWGARDQIIYHEQSSLDVPPDMPQVEFAFFDGDHDEEFVIREWRTWYPHLHPGALVVWHDAIPGGTVSRALHRIGQFSPALQPFPLHLPTPNGMVVARYWHAALFQQVYLLEQRLRVVERCANIEREQGNHAAAVAYEQEADSLRGAIREEASFTGGL